ncbi:MAG: hypothetical protein Q7S68_01680, partial [Deltaproteobacteria bacterium]|nr:hypothetical protein [Deltaproteobacteria bacterium]
MVDRIAGNHSSDRSYFYNSLSKEEPSLPILIADGDVFIPPPDEKKKAVEFDLYGGSKDNHLKNVFSGWPPLTPNDQFPVQIPMPGANIGPEGIEVFPPQQGPPIYGPLPYSTPLFKRTFEEKSEAIGK